MPACLAPEYVGYLTHISVQHLYTLQPSASLPSAPASLVASFNARNSSGVLIGLPVLRQR